MKLRFKHIGNWIIKLAALTIFFVSLYFLRKEIKIQWFDYTHSNSPVRTQKDCVQLLKQFQQVSLKEIPSSIQQVSGLNQKKYKNLTTQNLYFKIPTDQIHQKIVGHFRISDFLSEDLENLEKEDTVYWCQNPTVLFKLIELQTTLQQLGYDQDAMIVRFGHRTPHLNSIIHGASRSRHIAGEAIDLSIGDINRDGKTSAEDKKIVLQLCDSKIIGNEGGIGLYPGTFVVHIDVRGYRARWNSY